MNAFGVGMSAMVVRKLTPVLLTVALLAIGLAAPAEAEPRVVKGGFTATATPFPNPWTVLPGMNGCSSGTEGQHKVSRTFTAPFAGWFHATLTFEGDWDLYLADAKGDVIAESYENKGETFRISEPQPIDYFLSEGQEVTIVACNWAGSQEAEVRYRLRAARPWPGPPTGEITHEELLWYNAPAAATTDNHAYCWDGLSWGCFSFPIWGGDRSVSLKVEDNNVPAAAFYVRQFHKRTLIDSGNHCGSTKKPIEIHPRADKLSIEILTGPCEGSSGVETATRGTIRAEFKG
jgi:hypothetical protein